MRDKNPAYSLAGSEPKLPTDTSEVGKVRNRHRKKALHNVMKGHDTMS